MADVSVEFGAKDTGLEQTLKTVQAQLSALEEEVKSGELSFEELQQAMRKIAQAEKVQDQLNAMADATQNAGDAASDAAPQIDDSADSMGDMGESATDAGEKSEGGFLQMAAAVAAGQAAVELAMGAIKAAIDTVVGTFDKFGQALNKGAELDILSTRTGVASGELARLGRALENTGASADMLGPIFDKMNRALAGGGEEGGKASEALGRLGINMEALKAMSPEQQFETIGKALSGVADRSERVDMAMDIFGRGSGSRLLRLFEDYEGTMAQVDRQLGIFPSIMNGMSASFEAASTEINAAKEKMVEFATGILSRVMPAVEAIATGLASIDAAALGQKLADAFTGGTAAMQGFQSAIDAIKLGEFGLAFELIFESIKLQLMQTGNEIVRVFSSAFKTASEIIGEVFRKDGPTFMLIKSSFDYVAGYAKEKLAGAMSEMFASMGPAFANISKSLEQHADAGAKSAELALARIPVAAELAAEDIGRVLGESPQKFKENLAATEAKFFNIQEQSQKVADIQAKIAEEAAKVTPKLEDSNKELEILKQNSILFGDNIKSSGNAAADAAKETEKIKDGVGGAVDEAEQFKSFVEYMKGQDLGEPVKSLRDKTADARKEIEAFGNYIGKDLSRMSFPDVAKKLGVDILGKTGSQQIDAILSHVKSQLPDGKLTQPIDEKKSQGVIDGLSTKLETDLKKSIDVALQSSAGTSVLERVEKLVGAIKTLVEKIEPKLPQQALV